jgi:hypothetical protein
LARTIRQEAGAFEFVPVKWTYRDGSVPEIKRFRR